MARRFVSAALVATLGLILMGGLTTRAQETSGLPVTPDPSECTVEPLTVDELIAIMGSPVPAGTDTGTDKGDDDGAEASPAAFVLPTGEPADEATRAAITATVRMALACFNAGDFLAFLALSTGNFLQSDSDEPLTEDDLAFLMATPQPAEPTSWNTLVDVRDVIVLPDGRIGALIDTIFPDEEPGVQTDFFYFVQEDGQWKFDDIIEDLESQFPPEATGTPAAA